MLTLHEDVNLDWDASYGFSQCFKFVSNFITQRSYFKGELCNILDFISSMYYGSYGHYDTHIISLITWMTLFGLFTKDLERIRPMH